MGIPEIELISEDELDHDKKPEESVHIDDPIHLTEERNLATENKTLKSNSNEGIVLAELDWCPRFVLFPSSRETITVQTAIMTKQYQLQKYIGKSAISNFLYWHCQRFHNTSSDDFEKKKRDCKAPWKEGNFLSFVFSENFILALCNLISINNRTSELYIEENKNKEIINDMYSNKIDNNSQVLSEASNETESSKTNANEYNT